MTENNQNLAIEVSHVKKNYKLYDKRRDRMMEALGLKKNAHKDHLALKDVSLSVKKGETIGIIGTNGSGKSTLLKIITGVLTPTEGEVRVDGRISALLELGAGFNMEYNGIENVYLNGTMMGFSEREIEKRLPDILDFADIGDYVYQPVKTYSSGMFVRLAFAVAINIDPEILIVDEALSVGDVFFQSKCYKKFDDFKKAGKTIVFVSHDLSSISKYCDRVYLLNQGKLEGEGSPKQMIDIYKQILVGQYNADSKEISEQMSADPTLEYGSRKGEIIEYWITDENGVRTTAIIKGTEFTVHMKVKFYENVPMPIFAYSIKNPKGIEIVGTNTLFENAYADRAVAGEVFDITFTQKMLVNGGDYLISLGCTGYEGETFEVYHRLYDVCNITVISDKHTVGYVDLESKITVDKSAKEETAKIIQMRTGS